jgi:6-phosphogluconolactonase
VSLELLVLETAEDAARATADLLVGVARAGADIALSGGSTPRPAHELAAEEEPDWRGVTIWLADERVVPQDDPLSNARLVRETLLDRLEAPPEAHFIRTELGPAEAAADYDRMLRGTRLGLALLGIGPDGHTASLFPGAPPLREQERLAVAAAAGFEPFVPRVTLTLPVLRAARHVVFLVTGADKAAAVRRAFAEEPSESVPASLVRSDTGTTTAILDAAAASELPQ